jgi:ankyrin repeat protein
LLELLNRQKNGVTPLIEASKNCNIEICRLLLEKSADPNILNDSGSNALIFAAFNDCFEICSILLEKGVNPNIKNSIGNTALTYAGYYKVVNLLLDKGAETNILSKDGNNVLISFLTKNLHKLYDLRNTETTGARLLDIGIDPNFINNQNETALILAAKCNFLALSFKLLDMGTDPNIQTNFGITALMEAAINGNTELCKKLLEHGADPNTIDPLHESALHKACRYKRLETAKLLAEHMSHDVIIGVNNMNKLATGVCGFFKYISQTDDARGVVTDKDLEHLQHYLDNIINPDLK